VARKDFIGLSNEAIEIVNARSDWFEHRVMMQVFLAYQNALAKTQDVISAVSDAARIIATHAANAATRRCFTWPSVFSTTICASHQAEGPARHL